MNASPSRPGPILETFVMAAIWTALAAADTRAEEPPSEAPPSQQVAASFDGYDPLAGMDASGRIPGLARPPGVPHPERWRYVPEGRLKPGNIFQRLLVSSFIAPFAFHDSDTGTGFGVALTDLEFRNQRRQERLASTLSYSTEGQQEYLVKWRRWFHHLEVPTGGILQEERSFVEVEMGYVRTLTSRFFGLGADSKASDETSYADSSFFGELGVDWTVPDPGSDLVFRVAARGESHNLSGGHVSGDPSTADVFPDLFADSENRSLGWLSGSLRWDTRDSQENPYTGWHVEGTAAGALLQEGGDVGALFSLNAGKVFRVPPLFHNGGDRREENPPTDTLVFGLWNEYSAGSLPFFALPTLGGSDRLRGYIGGRFRGGASWLGAAEYRFWFLPRGIAITRSIRIERVGAALFYEVGSVGDGAGDLLSQSPRQSYGVSLRLTLERAAPFRFDFAFSDEGSEFTAGFGLAF